MADMLSRQYTSVFSTPLPDRIVRDPHTFFHSDLPTNMESMLDVVFTQADIEDALSDLKITRDESARDTCSRDPANCMMNTLSIV